MGAARTAIGARIGAFGPADGDGGLVLAAVVAAVTGAAAVRLLGRAGLR